MVVSMTLPSAMSSGCLITYHTIHRPLPWVTYTWLWECKDDTNVYCTKGVYYSHLANLSLPWRKSDCWVWLLITSHAQHSSAWWTDCGLYTLTPMYVVVYPSRMILPRWSSRGLFSYPCLCITPILPPLHPSLSHLFISYSPYLMSLSFKSSVRQ